MQSSSRHIIRYVFSHGLSILRVAVVCGTTDCLWKKMLINVVPGSRNALCKLPIWISTCLFSFPHQYLHSSWNYWQDPALIVVLYNTVLMIQQSNLILHRLAEINLQRSYTETKKKKKIKTTNTKEDSRWE